MSKDFWISVIPRVAAVIIALALLCFVLLDLFVRSQQMSSPHFWLLVLAGLLVLTTIASRLKIFNFIDFNSYKHSTDKELADIKQQLSASVQQQISPSQQVSTTLNIDFDSLVKTATKTVIDTDEGQSEHNRTNFLRRADAYRMYAVSMLQIARMYQVVIVKHEIPLHSPTEEHKTSQNAPIVKTSTDDSILTWSTEMLQDGIQNLFPFVFSNDQEDILSRNIQKGVESCLRLLPRFLELRAKVDSNELPLPSQEETKDLFDKLSDGLGNIRVSILMLGSEGFPSTVSIN